MANKGEKPQAPAGFFGRLWGGGKSPEGGKRKAIKANLGETNKLYYDDKLKRWREAGKELEPEDLGPGPPPLATAGFSHSRAANSASEDKGHRRSVSSGRYAHDGGFGSKTAQSTPSTSPFPAPRPNTAPGAQPSFLIPGQGGGSAGKPAFFNPSKAATPADNPFAPAWGQQKPAPPEFTQQSTPRGGLSPRSPGFSPRGSAQQTSPTELAARKSLEFSGQGQPPQGLMRGLEGRSRSGESGTTGFAAVPEEDESDLSMEQWRQQDEKRREKEREAAAELGAQVLESFTQPISEGVPGESETAVASLQDAEESQGYNKSWSGAMEESVGENVLRDSSASFAAWGAQADEGAVTSPAQQPETGLTPRASQGGDSARAGADGDFGLQGAADGFFDEVPGISSEATFQGWGQEEGSPEKAASMVMDGQYEMGAGDVASSAAWEQTYGGLTWAQLQEWAEYYKQQGSTEEQVQDWVNGYLASPDPFPGTDAVQAAAEGECTTSGAVTEEAMVGEAAAGDSPPEAAAEGQFTNPHQEEGVEGGVGAAEAYPGFLEEVGGGAESHAANLLVEEPIAQGHVPGEADVGADESSTGFVNAGHDNSSGGDFGAPDSLSAIGAELAANGDLMKPIRDYVAAQQAANPMFGKLIGPLPWDGILTDDEESPYHSPRLQWGNTKPAQEAKGEATSVSLPPIVAEAIQSLSAAVGPGQTNDWLQKVRQNLAEEQAHADGNGRSAQASEGRKSRSGRSTPKAGDREARHKSRRRDVNGQPVQAEHSSRPSNLRPERGQSGQVAAVEGPSALTAEEAAAGKLPPVKVVRGEVSSQASGRSLGSSRSSKGPMVLGSGTTPKGPATPHSAKSSASGRNARSSTEAVSRADAEKLPGTPESARARRQRRTPKHRVLGGEAPSVRTPNGCHAPPSEPAEVISLGELQEIREGNSFADHPSRGRLQEVDNLVSLEGLRDDPMDILGPISPREDGQQPSSEIWDQQTGPDDSLAAPDSLARPAAENQHPIVNSWGKNQPGHGHKKSGFESAAVEQLEGAQGDGWGEDGWDNAEGSWENGGESIIVLPQSEHSGASTEFPQLDQKSLNLPPLKNLKSLTPMHDHEPPTSRAQVAEVEELRQQLAEAEERMRESQDITFQDHSMLTELKLSEHSSKNNEAQEAQRALEAERATLAADRATIENLRATLEADREALAAEKAALKASREAAAGKEAESARLAAEQAAVSALRAELEAAQEALRAEREEVEAEKEELAGDREALIEENDQLLADREALDEERNSLAASHESIAADKERLATKLQALGSQQEALQSELDSLAAERRELEAQRAALEGERSRSAESAGGSTQELAAQIAQLHAEVDLLKASAAAMAAENEALADDLLSKDEEIEQLTGQLVHAQKDLQASREVAASGGNVGISDEELAQMREQARLDFDRIGKLAEQNQELQDRLEELEEQEGTGSSERIVALEAERSQVLQKLQAAEKAAVAARRELKSLKAAYEQLTSRASEAGELAAAFEQERDTINSQISELVSQRNSLSSENATLRDNLSKAEAAAAKHASLAEEVAEQRRYLAAAEEAAAAGADAVAENDSLGSRLADTKMKLAAVEADLDSVTASRDSLQRDLETLREQLVAVEAEAAAAAADSFTEQDRLATELAGVQEQLAALQAGSASASDAEVERQRLEQKIAALQDELLQNKEAAAAEQALLAGKLTAVQEELSASQEAVSAESDERRKLLEDMAKLEETLQAAEDAATQRETLQQRVDDLEARLADALESREALSDELAQQEAALRSAAEAVQARERIGSDMDRLQGDLDAARAQVAEGEAKVDELTASMGNLGGEIGALHTTTGELGARIQELTTRMLELEEENEALFERATAAEEASDASNGRALAAKAEAESLAHRLATAETSLREASQKLAEARSSMQQPELADAEKQQLRERVAWAEERISQLESQLADAQAQLHVVSATLADAQSQAGGDTDLAAQLAEKDQDFTDLMVCLGQETAKVEALSERLREHGLDVDALLTEVEAAYGYGDEDAPPPEEETLPDLNPITAQREYLDQASAVPQGLPPQPFDVAYGGEHAPASESLPTAHAASDTAAFSNQHPSTAATTFDGFAEKSAGPSAFEQHETEEASASFFQHDSGGAQQRSAAEFFGRVAAHPGAELFTEDPAADLFSGEHDGGSDFFGIGSQPGRRAAEPAEVWQDSEGEKSMAGLFPPAAKALGGVSAGDLSFLDNPLEDAEGDWGI